jgi:hypothetical protein
MFDSRLRKLRQKMQQNQDEEHACHSEADEALSDRRAPWSATTLLTAF